jgi:hypothetical protein
MPMARDAAALRAPIAELRERYADAGRGAPEVVVLAGFSRKDPSGAAEQARAFADAGATQLVFAERYADAADFRRGLDFAAAHLRPALG